MTTPCRMPGHKPTVAAVHPKRGRVRLARIPQRVIVVTIATASGKPPT
jgi:hypothetical protein